MVIWRSVGVQALADALSRWADRRPAEADTPPCAADPAVAAEGGPEGRLPRAEPRIVHNAERRG